MHTYDDFPYLCLIRPDIQASQLATLATLFNLQPPLVTTARILELGCGNGMNLIVTAQSLPQTTCLGIDYSARQIADGQKIIKDLGLSNITLRHLDILEFDEAFGTFDYIIIHGVYSWVAQPVQTKLLNICQSQLTPQGLSYISYNTYPGWHLTHIARDLLRYFHAQQFQDARAVHPSSTLELWQLVVALNRENHDAYSLFLQEQGYRLQQKDTENYLRHDLLEDFNQPCYFYQFLEQIHQHHLEYVTDVKFRDFLPTSPLLQTPIAQQLFTDFFAQEQYLDFFFGRKLRMSLICHQGQPVKRQLEPNLLSCCYLTASLQPQSQLGIFRKANGKPIIIETPATQIAVLYLTTSYPHNILFENLVNYVKLQLPATSKQLLASELLNLYYAGVIELNTYPTHWLTTTISDYPTVSPLARWQADHGQTTVANLLGQIGQLDDFTCQLLPHLNGKHNHQALLKIMDELVIKNNLTCLLEDEQEVSFKQLASKPRQQILNFYLEATLATIAKSALLVA